jgi:hypothetical protein
MVAAGMAFSACDIRILNHARFASATGGYSGKILGEEIHNARDRMFQPGREN